MTDFATARRNMVDAQIRTNRVTDPAVIEAMGAIPRERFVDKHLASVAYVDEDLPLGDDRYLMEPMILARLLQVLDVGDDDVVLDIGCATGYSSAVLSRLALTVVAVECDAELARRATVNLAELGIDNAVVVEGRLGDGYPRQAPYDAILLGGAVPEVPAAIADQLSDGGRLCAVVGETGLTGKAMLVVRRSGVFSHRVVFDANTPALPGFERRPGFVF